MAIVDLDFIAWRDEQRERFPQFFNDLSASRVHMAFREEVALAAFRAGKAIGRDRALSHAAGQEAVAWVEFDEAVELAAECVYDQWKSDPNFVPWTPGGNSDKQYLARDIAKAALCTVAVRHLTPAQPPASAGVDVIDRAIEPIAWKLESTIRVPVGVRPSDISDGPLAPPEVTVYETRYRWRADFFAITNEAESAPESYVLRSILPRDDAASSGRKGGDI